VFYKLLGLLTWKAIRYYVRNNVPTRKIAAAAVVGTVGVIAISSAVKHHEPDA
jgi:hypothetical protein